jgi:hypothetical protein
LEDVDISEFDYWYTQIRHRLIVQYGAKMTLKTLQQILYFNSLDALVAAINSNYVVIESATLMNGLHVKIKTESVAKYIANQYVIAAKQQQNNEK